MRISRDTILLNKMKIGHVYRRHDLARHSAAVDRYLNKLVNENKVVKITAGLYVRPKVSLFGNLPPDDNEMVSTFLNDNRFLINSFNNYNQLGLGLTQLYNNQVVYNYKRHGDFELGGKKFFFKRVPKFPRHLTKEFLLVDLLNNLKNLAEDENHVIETFLRNKDAFDSKKILATARKYARPLTQKILKNAYTP